MRILVEREFEHEGRKFEAGETVELPEEVASDLVEEGLARNAEEIEGEIEVTRGDEVEPADEERGGEPEPAPEDEGSPMETSVPAEAESPDSPEPGVWEDLESELDEGPSRAPAWEPSEPGDQLLGEVVRTGRGPNGRLLEVESPRGERRVLWERVALKDLFDRAEAGDRIGVRFLGEEESSSGRSYYNFRTVLRRRENHR